MSLWFRGLFVVLAFAGAVGNSVAGSGAIWKIGGVSSKGSLVDLHALDLLRSNTASSYDDEMKFDVVDGWAFTPIGQRWKFHQLEDGVSVTTSSGLGYNGEPMEPWDRGTRGKVRMEAIAGGALARSLVPGTWLTSIENCVLEGLTSGIVAVDASTLFGQGGQIRQVAGGVSAIAPSRYAYDGKPSGPMGLGKGIEARVELVASRRRVGTE